MLHAKFQKCNVKSQKTNVKYPKQNVKKNSKTNVKSQNQCRICKNQWQMSKPMSNAKTNVYRLHHFCPLWNAIPVVTRSKLSKVWIMLIFVKYFSPILAGKILARKLEVEVHTAISKGKQSTNIAMVLLQDP